MNRQPELRTMNIPAPLPGFARHLLPFLVILAATVPCAWAQNLITNGNFETGTFAGWTEMNQAGGAGNFYINAPGSNTPFGFPTAANPIGGSFYAVTDTSGPGSHVLYQSFVVPANVHILSLSFQMFTNNQPGVVFTPPNLNYNLGAGSNEQARVDILNSVASPFDVGASVVSNLYDGASTGANPHAYTAMTFNLIGVASTPGTYYLRFAEADNQGQLNLGIDNVSLIAISTFSPSGLTPNQQAVLSPLDQGLNNGNNTTNFAALINALVNSNGSQSALAATLDTFSPEKLQIFSNIAFNNFGFTATQLDQHLASLHYGRGGFDTSGLEVLDSSMPSELSHIKNRLLAFNPAPVSGGLLSDVAEPVLGGVTMSSPRNMQGVVAPVAEGNRWSAFVSGNVILADLESSADVANAHYKTGGVMAGSDYRIDDHWAVGGLFNYSHTHAELDRIGSAADVDSYSPGVYATYVDGGWYANGLFAYSYNNYGENRAIPALADSATGSTSGSQYGSNLDGGYEFHRGDWTFGPTAALQYVHLDINGFTERGGGALDIDSENADSLRSRIGGQMHYNWSWYGGKVTATPYLSATWQHEYLDNSRGITSQFDGTGAGPFTVNTFSPDRDSALINAGLDTQWNSALNLFIDYQVQAGQSDFFAQSIEGGAKVSF